MNRITIFKLRTAPYNLFGLVAFILAILSFFLRGISIDLNSHDIYYVIKDFNFCRLFAVFLFFLWAIYIVINSWLLSLKLSWIHILTTLLAVIGILFFLQTKSSENFIPRKTMTFEEFEKEKAQSIVIPYTLLIGAFILSQVIFIINLIGGFIKNIRK